MPHPIQVGVIGIGFGRQVHVPAFRSLKRCVVAGLCSSDPERAQRAAQELRIPRVYGNWRDMVKDPRIDALALSVPPSIQAVIVPAAAASGKHVFCEKPAALNAAQAADMLRAVKKYKVAHAVNFLFPELETWRRTKMLLNKGSLGRVRFIAVTWKIETYSYRKSVISWKRRLQDGGGTLSNFASHSFYYLEWLFGKISKLDARLTPEKGPSEARVDIGLEFSSGLTGSLGVAADAFLGGGHRIEVFGDAGTLVLENPAADYVSGFSLSVGTRAAPVLRVLGRERSGSTDGRIAATARIAGRFLQSIDHRGRVNPDLEDGLRVQQLIDAARTSHQRRPRDAVRGAHGS